MSSWRRGCRSSSGAASRTTNCSTWRREGNSAIPRCSSSKCDECWPTRDPRRSSKTSAANGCTCAISPRLPPDGRMFPMFDDNLRQAFSRKPNCSSRASSARTAACWICSRPITLSRRAPGEALRHPNVYGTQFRRVTLPADSVRGGLLGQGSILLATSYANRTSPVLRGKWVLENIIGTPPPAPPPGVPPLKEAKSEDHVPTMRERMVEHRANPACSVVPHADGSDRAVDGELRRDRPLARQGGGTVVRSTRRAACRTAPRSKASQD